MNDIKVAFIGLGCRGFSLLKDVILPQKLCSVTAVCDVYDDRAEAGAKPCVTQAETRRFILTAWKLLPMKMLTR